jgi:hypothetical protein
MVLYCDVWRNLNVEIHSCDCKDVVRAKVKGFMCGTVEGNTPQQAIETHIKVSATSGIDLDASCYRVMPCVKLSHLTRVSAKDTD